MYLCVLVCILLHVSASVLINMHITEYSCILLCYHVYYCVSVYCYVLMLACVLLCISVSELAQ